MPIETVDRTVVPALKWKAKLDYYLDEVDANKGRGVVFQITGESRKTFTKLRLLIMGFLGGKEKGWKTQLLGNALFIIHDGKRRF